jgi:hypothetical protein
MGKQIETSRGLISVIEPSSELISELKQLLKFGLYDFGKSNPSTKYGFVMQCEHEEVICLKQQPVEVESSRMNEMFQIQHLMICEAYTEFVKANLPGAYLATPYIINKADDKVEVGVAHFIFPDPNFNYSQSEIGKSVGIELYDEDLGRGATTMFMEFHRCYNNAFENTGFPKISYIGIDVRRRNELLKLAMFFMVLRDKIICLRSNLREDTDPAWSIFANHQITEVTHLPSVPMEVTKEQLLKAKG